MALIESWVKCELSRAVQVQYLQGNLFSADNQGNLVGVRVFENGEPASLSGSVSANVIRADGTTVPVAGTLTNGNECYVILPQAAYAVTGVVTIVIKITASSVVTTLAAIVSTVYASTTDAIVDPGTIIPSIETLIAAIEAAVATIPADYSSLWATIAPAYTSLTFPVSKGQYCTNNGHMYRAKQDIATSETFTSSHWEVCNVGVELFNQIGAGNQAISELKSACDALDFTVNTRHNLLNYNYNLPYYYEKDDTADNSDVLGIQRNQQILIFNKTTDIASNRKIYVRINNMVRRTVVESKVDGWPSEDGISLVAGHTYRAIFEPISGTKTTGTFVAMVCPVGSHTTVGTGYVTSDGGYYRDFIAEENIRYNLILRASHDARLDNYKISFYLEDITGKDIVDFSENQKQSVLRDIIDIPRSLFIYRRSRNMDGSMANNVTYATTSRDIISLSEPFRVEIESGYVLRIYDPIKQNSINIENNYNSDSLYGYITIYKKNHENFISSDFQNIVFYTTKEGKQDFENKYYITVKHTQFLESNSFVNWGLGIDTENVGMLIGGNPNRRTTVNPYISPYGIDLYCGQFGTNHVDIIINNEYVGSLTNGRSYYIPANTLFSFSCYSSAGGADDDTQKYDILVVHGEEKPDAFTRVLSSSAVTRADASILTNDDKIFMVSYSNDGIYSVKQGNTFIVSAEPLDHNPGHCNSGNYSDGKFYVSYWSAPQNNGIAVYNVDAENNTLSYEKDILLPITEEFENTGYYVFDEEKQIFFLGWGMIDGSTRDSLIYGLYIKVNNGYKLAWKRFATRIENILQGFTIQDNYIYMAESAMDYKFVGLRRINMSNGSLEYSRTAFVEGGTLSNSEVESVIPIEKEQFILTDRYGKVYFYVWS